MQAAGQLEDRSRRAVPGPSIGLDKQGADALKRAKQEEYRRQLDQQHYLRQPPQTQRHLNNFEEENCYVPADSGRAYGDYAGPTKYMPDVGRGGKDSSSSDRASKRIAAEEYRRDLDRQLEEKRLRTLSDRGAEDVMDARSKPTQDDTYNHRPRQQTDGPVDYIAPYRTAPADMQHQPFREQGEQIDKDDRFTYLDGGYYAADDNHRGGDYDTNGDALRLAVPLVTGQSSNKPTPRKSPVKSPNQARARFMQDIYGGDNLIARVESDASTTWKPSGRTADVRHKQVILGQKAALDAQLMEVRARKEKEKEDARLEDEKQDMKIREALAIDAEQAKKEKEKVLSVH